MSVVVGAHCICGPKAGLSSLDECWWAASGWENDLGKVCCHRGGSRFYPPPQHPCRQALRGGEGGGAQPPVCLDASRQPAWLIYMHALQNAIDTRFGALDWAHAPREPGFLPGAEVTGQPCVQLLQPFDSSSN